MAWPKRTDRGREEEDERTEKSSKKGLNLRQVQQQQQQQAADNEMNCSQKAMRESRERERARQEGVKEKGGEKVSRAAAWMSAKLAANESICV